MGFWSRIFSRRASGVVDRPVLSIEEIVAQEYCHQVFHGMRDRIFKTRVKPLESYESYSPRLSEGEKMVILLNGFIWEVTNGGVDQFLTNSTGDNAEDIRGYMLMIGATTEAEMLQKIADEFFEGRIPKNRREREERLRPLFDTPEYKELLDQMDQQLGWCELLEEKIARYIVAHVDQFQ